MLSTLAPPLCLTAFLAGVTGTWSPCGFSVIDTLRSRRSGGSCIAFALGALAGGAAMFGALAAIGRLLHVSGPSATLVAVGLAAAAAAGEAQGIRIVPQIRSQVPEPWRRILPLPVAAALYGVLLGLGFTTFVLTLALPALAGICLALANAQLGAAAGLAFGLGRALPVVVLARAPAEGRRAHAIELLAERPSFLRRLRRLDALALAVSAAALGATAATAATRASAPATDPSTAGADVAWEQPGVGGFLRREGQTRQLPGHDPAIGGPYVAWRVGDEVTVARRDTFVQVLQEKIAGVQKLAISSRWLVFRQGKANGDTIIGAHPLPGPTTGRYFGAVHWPAQLGRPSISNNVVVFHVANRQESAIVSVNLKTGIRRIVRRSTATQLLNPAVFGAELLYVRATQCDQQVRLALLAPGRERVLLRRPPTETRDAGHEVGHTSQGAEPTLCPRGAPRGTGPALWTTALAPRAAYVTLLRPAAQRGAPTLLTLGR